ncbi:MAG TPA: hypothetical protein EYN03_01825 [Planctomycetes bacterium]|nr:hypothetical protein [Planctomycetota bacterium]
MSKKKVQLKESGFNAFLLHHAEKVGLGTAILLALMFILMRPSTENDGTDKSPVQLDREITRAHSHIQSLDDNVWETEILPQRQPPNDYPERVRKQQESTVARFYATPIPFDPPKMVPLTKRRDPELYAVTDIQLIPATVCLAYNPTDTLLDPTKRDEDATLEEVKKKSTRPPRRRRPRYSAGGGDEAGLEDEGLGMPEDLASGLGGGATSGPGATVNWTYGSDKVRGYRARPYIPKSGEDVFIAPGDADVIGVHRPMIAVVALAPYKKQFDQYKEVFGSAVSYDRRRDKPAFLSFMAERVDVSDDPNREFQENEWQPVKSSNHYIVKEVPQWNGTATDTYVPSDHLDEQIVMPCPPIMMRDLKQFMWHPKLPLRGQAARVEDQLAATETAERKEEEDLIPGMAAARKKNNAGTSLDGGGPGMAPGMDPGMGDDEMGMDDMGMEGMMGDMMGGGGESFLEEEIPVDYKLVRFYDFDVQPGHSYRYRIRLILEDPNNPNITSGRELTVHTSPELHTLEDDVRLRLRNLNDEKNRKFFRYSPWSDPTPTVHFPQPEQVLVNTVQAPKINIHENHKFTVEEPKGVVKTIVWDEKRAVDVPIDRVVLRGSILNFQGQYPKLPDKWTSPWKETSIDFSGKYQYAHPFSHLIKNIDGFSTETDWFIADIQGGELIGGTKEDPLYSPGEFAIIDANGNLIIRNELDDADEFYRFTLKPKQEAAAADSGASTADEAEDLTGQMEGLDEDL